MSSPLHTVAVIGGGSWATALVKILADNGHAVRWWMRDPDAMAHIAEHGRNPRYLRSASLNLKSLTLCADLREAVRPAQLVLLAVPAAFLSESTRPLSPADLQGKAVLSAVKGMEPLSQTTITRWAQKRFELPEEQLCVVGGPCHAEEVAEDLPAYLTIGAEDSALGAQVATMLTRPHIRTAHLPDTVGIEWAAVLKNIYAVAAGIAGGIGYGDNFRAVLVSSAAREMRSFLDAVAPLERDILHSVYLGDLLVTAYSQHSRNRTFGLMVGHGYHVRAAQLEMKMIAEGFYATKSVWQLCRERGLSLPIAEAVYRVLYEQVAPKLEFGLMRQQLG
jgi:glycerol-3-phosphate dehydrogenase (NAD(P)+)